MNGTPKNKAFLLKGKVFFLAGYLELVLDPCTGYQNQNNDIKLHYSEDLLFDKAMPSKINPKEKVFLLPCLLAFPSSFSLRKIREEKFCVYIPQTMTLVKREESSFLKIILKGGKFRHMLQPGCTLKTWCSVK